MRANASSADHLLRSGVMTYVIALLLIAAFSIACHLVTDSIIQRQAATAKVISLTGRQRMLAQRIVRLSIERAIQAPFRSPEQTDRLLDDSLSGLEQGYASIQKMRSSTRTSLSDPAVQQVYTGAPWNLDAQMSAFLKRAHALRDRPAGEHGVADPDLVALGAAVNDRLINALSAAVDAVGEASETSIKHLRRLLAALTAGMLLLLLLEAMLLYRPLFNRLRRSTQELVRVGRTDPLTGCLNRRAFLQEAEPVIRRARQMRKPVCVLMVDLDRFKAVNDQYGHAAGDAVINGLVATTLEQIRENDLLCRMGGEEFAVLLPGSTLETASLAAERLRTAVETARVALDSPELGLSPHVTVSIGVAVLHTEDDSIFPLLGRADRALYAAKKNGRNRVEQEQAGHVAIPGSGRVSGERSRV